MGFDVQLKTMLLIIRPGGPYLSSRNLWPKPFITMNVYGVNKIVCLMYTWEI